MLLFGRARSLAIASPLPSLRSSTPSGRVPSHRSYVSCMHLSAPLPPSRPDPEKGPTTAPREANWMRIGCELVAWPPRSSSCLHAKATPENGATVHGRLRSTLRRGSETAPMGNSELSVCRHSRALNLGEQYFRARVSAAPCAARHGGGRAVAAVIDDAASDKGEYEYDDHGYDDQ